MCLCIKLTKDQALHLKELLDIALKSTGVRGAQAVMYFINKIDEAKETKETVVKKSENKKIKLNK